MSKVLLLVKVYSIELGGLEPTKEQLDQLAERFKNG